MKEYVYLCLETNELEVTEFKTNHYSESVGVIVWHSASVKTVSTRNYFYLGVL